MGIATGTVQYVKRKRKTMEKYCYSYWLDDDGVEFSVSSDKPLTNNEVEEVARKRGHYGVCYIWEWEVER